MNIGEFKWIDCVLLNSGRSPIVESCNKIQAITATINFASLGYLLRSVIPMLRTELDRKVSGYGVEISLSRVNMPIMGTISVVGGHM